MGPPCQRRHPGACPVCTLYDREQWFRDRCDAATSSPLRSVLPCRHRGAEVRRELCPNCQGHVEVKVFSCARHGECTAAKRIGGAMVCGSCLDWEAGLAGAVRPVTGLAPGRVLNPSVLSHGGRTLLAYRRGWLDARLWVADADPGTWAASNDGPIRGALSGDAQEDPRLFVHRGRPHVAYTAYERGGDVAHMAYARLSDDGRAVEEDFLLRYSRREKWEKNWGLFDWEDMLFAVHTIAGEHRILEVEADRAADAFSGRWAPRWAGGLMRGGASPVRVGDEYYSWFHGALDHGPKRRTYTVGLYVFEAAPPFAPLRYTPLPLLLPDEAARAPGQEGDVVYPGGAILHNGRWLVAVGVQDRGCAVAEFDMADVEKALIPCK